MKLQEYLDNPFGKGESAFKKEPLIKDLNDRYLKYIKNRNITYDIYKLNSKDYYFKVIVPSEFNKNTYDVVIHMHNNNKIPLYDLNDYDIELFCNAPSFVFTHAYTYKENKIFINMLKNKIEKKVFKLQPEVRNRYHILSYEKHIYFAIKYITSNLSLKTNDIDREAKQFNSLLFNKSIRDYDTIEKEINKEKDKIKKEKKRERILPNKEKSKSINKTKIEKPQYRVKQPKKASKPKKH